MVLLSVCLVRHLTKIMNRYIQILPTHVFIFNMSSYPKLAPQFPRGGGYQHNLGITTLNSLFLL
jgi:hypothetical protein